jgi:hypothetical protein
VFRAGADRRERREALPVFWAALACGTAGLLALLLAVNYFGMQAGRIGVIADRLWR